MKYRNYVGLLERYNKLDELDFKGDEPRKAVIDRLVEVSQEKKKIQAENNDIIREYITKYEKAPERLDAEKLLQDFMSTLIQKDGACLDVPVALRISRLLLKYYQQEGNAEQILLMLERCSVFDIITKEHLDDYEGSIYPLMAEQYLEEFDHLSEQSQRALINCWFLSVINRKDMTFGLKKYKEIKNKFEEIRRKKGEDFMRHQYTLCKENTLGFTLEACRGAEYERKQGGVADGSGIDLKKKSSLYSRADR